MTPTNRLRFVERWVTEPHQMIPNVGLTKQIRILQQWWEDKESSRLDPAGEWRDVPLEEEQT